MARLRNATATSAGGVVIRYLDGIPHLVVGSRRREPDGLTWTLPKGTPHAGETTEQTALREVAEETGLTELRLGPRLHTIDWFFRFRGRLIHKYCHFYLIECPAGDTCPQAEEGITECLWLPLDEAIASISYDNAREVLRLAATQLRGASNGNLTQRHGDTERSDATRSGARP